MGSHQHPFVEEEQKLLEGLEERPLGQEADALLGDDLPVSRALPGVELEQPALGVGEGGLAVVLVETDHAAVHPVQR